MENRSNESFRAPRTVARARHFSVSRSLAASLLVAFLLAPSAAHAYIDPGTGSYILQAIVAAVAGGLMAIKMYWHRLKSFFARDSGDASGENESR